MSKAKLIPANEVLEEALAQNPELRKIWEANAIQREIRMAIIGERVKHKMT
jgi:hypothetical protein